MYLCNTMSETKNNVVAYYDEIAEEYDKDRFANSYGQFIDAQERRVLDALRIDPERALDLPCGTGRLTDYASMGGDASEGMMAIARRRHPQKEFRLMDATHTPFADGELRTVLSFHLLMHLDMDTVGAMVEEMYRVIEPGGRWICDIPSDKRRRLVHRSKGEWHGNTSLSIEAMRRLCAGRFDIRSVHGIMMAPVHRLPRGLRQPMCSIDYALANSALLKEYSSYMIFELCRC